MRKVLGLIASTLALSLLPFIGSASHLLGGEITWRCTANNSGYIFTMKLYKECGVGAIGLPGAETISGPNGNIGVTRTSIQEISPTCLGGGSISCGVSASGNGAVEVHTYVSGTVFLSGVPPAAGWIFSWNDCCRPGTVQNGPTGSYFLRAIMYPYTPQGGTAPLNTSTCFDNSPIFIEIGSLTQCEGSPFTYNHLAADVDLDSTFFKWADPWSAANSPVVWASGYSTTSPFPNTSTNSANGPVTLDGASGAVSMDVQVADAGSYASCFAIESWRCGQVGNKPGWIKTAEVFRDVAIIFRKNCDPNNEPIAEVDTAIYDFLDRNGKVYRTSVYPTDVVEFELNARDFDFLPSGAPQTIMFQAAGLMVADPLTGTTGCLGGAPCASFNPIAPQNSLSSQLNNNIKFRWVPNCSHLNFGNSGCGGSNTFYFSLRMQDDGCPAPEISLSTIIIKVIAGDPNPVEVKCLSYDPVNDQINLTWDPLERDSALAFNYFAIWASNNRSGPYTKIDSIYDVDSLQTSINHSSGYKHFYVQQSTGACDFLSEPSDTLDLMEITLTALPPVSSQYASLSWTPMITPMLPSSRGLYEIWAEAPAGSGNWVQVGETDQLTYIDTVQVCNAMVNYQIRITDTVNGCQSSSTIDSSRFSDQTNSDILNMNSITVGNNGRAVMDWPSSNYGDVEAYYILFNDPHAGWQIVDTVPIGTAMPYEYPGSMADSRSEEYKIISVDSCGNQSSDQLVSSYQTIFLKDFTNRCEGYTRLSWNEYKRFAGGVAGYRIWVQITDPGGTSSPWSLLYSGSPDDSVYTHSSLQNGFEYCYGIQAYDTTGVLTSSSNTICIKADVPKKSRLLYVAQVTNNYSRNSIDLVAYVDGEADVREYTIERALDRLGPYEVIGQIAQPVSVPYQIRFTDYGVRPGDHHYYYRLSAISLCGGRDTVSNTSQNVLLDVYPQANLTNRLVWNQYRHFDGNVDRYEIFRSAANTAGPFQFVGETKGNDSTFVDDISDNAAKEGDYCYYVKAVEGNNPIGFIDPSGNPYSSLSNRVCANQKPRIFVPTAFTPNSGILENRKFGPSMRFEDISSYNFYILNRWGKMVFQTSDPAEHWDGTYQDGDAPQGSYVYFVKYKGQGNVEEELKGSFSLIR